MSIFYIIVIIIISIFAIVFVHSKRQAVHTKDHSDARILFENHDLLIDSNNLSKLSNDLIIDSFTSGEHYTVNISNQICSCPDFVKNRSQIPMGELPRLCKHLVRAISDNWKDAVSAFADPIVQLEILNCIEFKRGLPYEIIAQKGVFENTKFFIVYNKTDWLNIYYPDNKQVLNRYGFSITENRWSYESNPFPSGFRREANKSILSLSNLLVERIGKLAARMETLSDYNESTRLPMRLPSLLSQFTQVGSELPEIANFGDSRFFQRYEYVHEIANQFGKNNSNVSALLAVTGNPAIYVRYGWTGLRRFLVTDRKWQFDDRPPNYKAIEDWLLLEWQTIKPTTSHISQTVIGKRHLEAHFSKSQANLINVFINDWPQHSYTPLKDEWNTAYKRTKNQSTENWLKQEWEKWTTGTL
jgi:hypothetical protein